MAGIYQQYRVDKCHYQIIFTTPGSATTSSARAPWHRTRVAVWVELQATSLRSMPEDPTESSLRRESVVAFCRERSTWRRCAGVNHAKYRADDPYAAYIGANPVQEILLSIATCAMDGTNGITCAYQVTLTFETLWFSRVIN